MYKECLTCPKLGISCDGANFIAMTAHELLEWCKLRKHRLGLSNASLADLSGVPKGTIDRVFSADTNDCKYETIRPIVRALVGEWTNRPCPTPEDAKKDERLIADLKRAETENGKLCSEIERLQQFIHEQTVQYGDDMAKVRANTENALILFKAQMRGKNIAIVVLAAALAVVLSSVIGVLVYDMLNPNVGWFRQ